MSDKPAPPRRSLREKLAVPPWVGVIVALVLLWFLVDRFRHATDLSARQAPAAAQPAPKPSGDH
jgi:hypothetical protein